MSLPEKISVWSEPKPAYIPRPTYFPVLTALGIVLLLMGIVTMWVFSIVGFVLFVVGLIGWVFELRHEQREKPDE